MSDRVKDVSSHYLGEQGERYEQRHHPDLNSPRYPYDFSFFKPFIKPQDAVLDFGCSNGGILWYSSRHATNSVGIEVNEYSADQARARGLTVYPSLESLPDDLSFDVIYSNHVLEHIPNVDSTLERLRARLKKNGLVLLKLPLDDWRAKEQRQWNKNDPNHHLYAWTPLSIGNLLTETGFDIVTINVLTTTYHPKLDPFVKIHLHPFLYWALAVYRKRRQLFAVARNS